MPAEGRTSGSGHVTNRSPGDKGARQRATAALAGPSILRRRAPIFERIPLAATGACRVNAAKTTETCHVRLRWLPDRQEDHEPRAPRGNSTSTGRPQPISRRRNGPPRKRPPLGRPFPAAMLKPVRYGGLVRPRRLELPRCYPLAPQASASTNSATAALRPSSWTSNPLALRPPERRGR